MTYDYLIIGAGLYGATFARLAAMHGKRSLVLEKRTELGGNCADEKTSSGILIHKHGPHIFHTSNQALWEFVNTFAQFTQFQNNVKALSNDKIYSMPFNLNTLNQVFGCVSPSDAIKILENETSKYKNIKPTNLDEQGRKLVGDTLFELLIKDYTEKQWGRSCKELSPEIITRLPVRTTYDNNYFNDIYQGLPNEGYSVLVKNMLAHELIDVQLNTTFCAKDWSEKNYDAKVLVYTGQIDEFYNFCKGKLEYRTLHFDTQTFMIDNYQGCPVLNRCDKSVAYTRSIEHKHFLKTKSDDTVVTFEYPKEFETGDEPYYPINNDINMNVYNDYKLLSSKYTDIIFGGRLGTYSYLNMDKTMEMAIIDFKRSFRR